MKRQIQVRLVGEIVLCIAIAFLLSIETYASPASSSSQNHLYVRSKQVQRYGRDTAKNIPADTVKPGKQLQKTAGLSALLADTPFSEAIEILRNSTRPPLNIVVLWKDIEENSDVTRDTPIGMESIPGISLGKNLEILLMSVSSDPKKLGYVVENGVILIGTKDSLPSKRNTRVYDITDLVSAPANYFATPGLGFSGLYGGGYGMPNGGYGGPYGAGYGMSYGGYGGPLMTGGYRTNMGRIRTPTSPGVSGYIMGGYRYNRGQDLADLIQTHTFGRNRPLVNNRRK